MTKITKATFKSFIKKNADQLSIRVKGCFNGQEDSMEYQKSDFAPAVKTEKRLESTLGFADILLINDSGSKSNWFKHYEDNDFAGIEVQNCSRHFIAAILKSKSQSCFC